MHTRKDYWILPHCEVRESSRYKDKEVEAYEKSDGGRGASVKKA